MINKLIIDDEQVELTGSSTPYYHTFPQAKTHDVRYGLDKTEEICAYAFSGCKNLTYISLPPKIKVVKREAFKDCESLPTITLGQNIEYVGKGAFDGCKNLNEIIFENSDPDKISMFATIPSHTKCFVPDNSKFAKVENYDDIDISGDVQYYTKTDWNQYIEVFDPADIKKENYGEDKNVVYINRWSDIAPGSQVKEMKDMKEITALELRDKNGVNSITMPANSDVTITYVITPFDATNKALYWHINSDILSINDDIGEPNKAIITSGYTGTLVNAKITVYSESGNYATMDVAIVK